MVTTLRMWDRLRMLSDDFNRRDFQFITAFADALRVHESIKNPGTIVTGDTLPLEHLIELINDQSRGSLVRTLARQYGIDNPKEILTNALRMIGAVMPDNTRTHYSDSLKTPTGRTTMKINESVLRRVVHQSVFGEDVQQLDPHLVATDGMYTFAIKIQYSTLESPVPKTEHLSVRASSAEAAKSMAARIAHEKNYQNFSVIDVEVVNYTGPKSGGLVPTTAPTNVQPGAMDGLVSPSDVSPALPDSGVVLPRSGSKGGNLTGGV
jgi:hypothetical protein